VVRGSARRGNRAKVVASTTPGRSQTRDPGALQRSARHLNDNFRLNDNNTPVTVRREPISKSCEITQADNLNRRRRLSRKAQ